MAGQTVKWLRNRAPQVATEQPGFMAVNFVNSHDIMSFDYGGHSEIAPPPNLAEAVAVKPPAAIPVYQRQWDFDLPASVADDLAGAPDAVRNYARVAETMFGAVPSHDAWRRGLTFSLNCIRDVDRSVGAVLDAVLTAVESVMTLDRDFWAEFGSPTGPDRIGSGELRPDWTKRGFLRGFTDERYSFGRYFSPLDPNRPQDLESLRAHNDVVLYDRSTDPDEMRNLAADPTNDDLVADCSRRLEALIDAEIGTDTRAWVTERPRLLGVPKWRGDAVPAGAT